MTYITWEQSPNGTWEAVNTDKLPVGFLRYERVGAFMHWCWYQYTEIRMSPSCLQDVRDMQRRLSVKKIVFGEKK